MTTETDQRRNFEHEVDKRLHGIEVDLKSFIGRVEGDHKHFITMEKLVIGGATIIVAVVTFFWFAGNFQLGRLQQKFDTALAASTKEIQASIASDSEAFRNEMATSVEDAATRLEEELGLRAQELRDSLLNELPPAIIREAQLAPADDDESLAPEGPAPSPTDDASDPRSRAPLVAESQQDTGDTDVAVSETDVDASELASTSEQETDAETGISPDRIHQVERVGYEIIDAAEISIESLTGAKIYGMSDEDIGEITDLILNTDGEIQNAMVNLSGKLGIGQDSVMVDFDELTFLRSEGGDELRVYVDATEHELVDSLQRRLE